MLVQSLHDAPMNRLPIRLSQEHGQNPGMLLVAIAGKSPIRRYEQSVLLLSRAPQGLVPHPFVLSAADIPHVVARFAQSMDRHQRDVFVDEDPHASPSRLRNRRNLLFGQRGRIVQTGQN